MKKLLCALLALFMVMGLSACSSNKSEETAANAAESAETAPAETSEAETEAVTASNFTRGTWDENRKNFVNEVTGIKLRIDTADTYMASTDEELVTNYLNGASTDLSSWGREEYEKEISIPELQVIDPFRGCNTGILYENLKAENATQIDENTYTSVVVNSLGQSNENFEAGEQYDLELSGHSYRAVDVNYTFEGRTVQQTLACRHLGDYMTVVVFTDFDDRENIEKMIGLFNK